MAFKWALTPDAVRLELPSATEVSNSATAPGCRFASNFMRSTTFSPPVV